MNKVLPSWVYEPMPQELTPCATISWDEEKKEFKILHPNQMLPTYFQKIENAYDHVQNVLKMQAIFQESVQGHGGEFFDSSFFCDVDPKKNTSRMLISFTDSDQLNLLKTEMDSFQELNEEYLQHPNDWSLAYNWLNRHPVFWIHMEKFYWETGSGLKNMWTSVWRESPEDEASVLLEHGGHVEPNYKEHYHDIRLDVKAKNFEKAYVKLARKVNKVFDSFGVERPNAPKPF